MHDHAIEYSSESGVRLVRSCASTLAKEAWARPPESLRGFNLIELTRKEHRVTGMAAKAFGFTTKGIKEFDDAKFVLREDGMFAEDG